MNITHWPDGRPIEQEIYGKEVLDKKFKVSAEGKFQYEIELPGCSSKDVEVIICENFIDITSMRNFVSSHYILTPPTESNLGTLSATIKDGLLLIELDPISYPEPRKVAVKQG